MILISDKLTPPANIQESFGELSVVQKEASGIAATCASGGLVYPSLVLEQSQRLKQLNETFGNLWKNQRTEVSLLGGENGTIFTPDHNAIVSFLAENGINSPLHVALYGKRQLHEVDCLIDKNGHVVGLSIEARPMAKPIFQTKSLQRLANLRALRLICAPSDPKELAKLKSLTSLVLYTQDAAEVGALGSLKLEDLKWYFSPLPDNAQKDEPKCIDIASFSKIKSLESLLIAGSSADNKNISIADLTALGSLAHLGSLRIYNAHIREATSTEELPAINGVELEYCEIADLSFLKKVTNLHILRLFKCSITCSSINYPPDIKCVFIADSTVKNLAALMKPLLGNAKLKELWVNRNNGGRFTQEEENIIRQLKERKVEVRRF